MKITANVSSPALVIPHDRIAARARELWEACGCPAGRDEEFWFEAERQLRLAAPSPLPATSVGRRGIVKTARDIDGLGDKTDAALGRVATTSESATSLDLGPR